MKALEHNQAIGQGHGMSKTAADWAASHDWFVSSHQAETCQLVGVWQGGVWVVNVRNDNGNVISFTDIMALRIWAGY